MDRLGGILRLFMEFEEDQVEVMKIICGSDFQQVQSAVTQLRKGVPTKRSRLEGNFPSPSDYGKLTNTYLDLLSSVGSRSGLHVSLQVEAFGHFIDQMNIEDAEIDSKFYNVATSLMMEMSKVFRYESRRQSTFLSVVKGLFPSCTTVQNEHAISDSTLQVEINNKVYNIVNWEFKCEMVQISRAIAQNISYFVHLQKRLHRTLVILYICKSVPMLLATVVGCHYFQVFGAVWNGSVVCIDPLCSPVSFLFVPRDPNHGVSKTARLLSAVIKCRSLKITGGYVHHRARCDSETFSYSLVESSHI